jgi:hypothetical protein
VPLHSLTLISHLISIQPTLTYSSPNAQSLCPPAPSAIPPSLHVLGNNNTTPNLHLTDLCDRFLHARCLGRETTRPTPNSLLLADNPDDSSSFLSFLLSFCFTCAHYFPCWTGTNRKGCMQKGEIGGLSQALILRRTNDIIVCTDGE